MKRISWKEFFIERRMRKLQAIRRREEMKVHKASHKVLRNSHNSKAAANWNR